MRFTYLHILLLFAFLLAETAILSAGPPQGKRKFQFAGEYGLWVEAYDQQLKVAWFTEKADHGFLEAWQDGRAIHTVTTSLAQAHRDSFAVSGESDVLLRYGSVKNLEDRHEMAIAGTAVRGYQPFSFENVDSIYAIGDVHGQYDDLLQLLQNNRLVDGQGRWKGGRRHLVFMGDLFDRGHNVIKTLWFLYRLEQEAAQQGGRVLFLLGNHEIMNFLYDDRYVSGKEKLVAQYHRVRYSDMFNPRRSVLGQWLASKSGLLKIDDVLFAHGGISLPYTAFTLQSYNDSLHAFLQEPEFTSLTDTSVTSVRGSAILYARRIQFFWNANSVFWYRGYMQSDTLGAQLQKVLDAFNAQLKVVGHTPVKSITQYYGGRLIAVDLNNPATEMLLLVRDKQKYWRYRCFLRGKAELM